MSQSTQLHELLTSLESELIRLGYTDGTMNFYRNRWKKLLNFAQSRGDVCFTEELGIAFASEVLNVPLQCGKLTQKETQDLRVVRMIGDFAFFADTISTKNCCTLMNSSSVVKSLLSIAGRKCFHL